MVGCNSIIPRWGHGSVITFTSRPWTFLSYEDAQHAEKSLKRAAEEWNRCQIGITFKWVNPDEDAVFELAYGGCGGSTAYTFAMSFFPNSKKRIMYVYEWSFQDKYWHSMVNIFLHELGHVMGLRHEFAAIKEKEAPAVPYGPANKLSVMNYFKDPKDIWIQKSDAEYAKKFYELDENRFMGFDIVDEAPQNMSYSKMER